MLENLLGTCHNLMNVHAKGSNRLELAGRLGQLHRLLGGIASEWVTSSDVL